MKLSCIRLFLALSGLTTLASFSAADPLLIDTLSPNTYTVSAGGQITLRGFYTTADAVTWTFVEENLFGLTPQSPHLGIVAGSIVFSMDFNPPIGGAYFDDTFRGGGYLGPPTIDGPTITGVSAWRTFIVPANTPLGTYFYSYGATYDPHTLRSSGLFDRTLQITVVSPEPATLWFLAGGLALLALRRRKYLQAR